MRAVRLALSDFNIPPPSNGLVATDITTVVAYISVHRDQQVTLNITTRARFISDKMNLSRAGQILPTKWSIHQNIVQLTFNHWGYPYVDYIVSRFNAKCQTFVSPTPDNRILDTDALAMDWEVIVAYTFPLHQILTQVLHKCSKISCCTLIIIAPFWHKQLWFPRPTKPVQRKTYTFAYLGELRLNIYHQNLSMLKLHAWRLSNLP